MQFSFEFLCVGLICTVNIMSWKALAKPHSCPANQLYNTCGSSCPKTCETKDKPVRCNKKCNQGCFCKQGYVLADDSEGAPCIPKSDCCGGNMEYSTCGTSCPRTCQNKDDQFLVCNFMCNQGCFCKEGYVLASDAIDAPCIPEEQCDKNTTHMDECPKNMEHVECGSSCPDYCGAPTNRICTANCVQDCFCKEGYILASNAADAPCIPKEECCPENMEFQACGSACPDYCGAPEFRICTMNCVQGCFCKQGYVLESAKDGAKCVPRNNCSII